MSIDTMVKKQEELENLKKYLKNLGLNEDSICKIASGNFKNENPVGKQVKYNDKMYVVRGVYRIPGKSVVMPNAVTNSIEESLEKNKEHWGFNYGLVLKLKKKSDVSLVTKALDEIFVEKN